MKTNSYRPTAFARFRVPRLRADFPTHVDTGDTRQHHIEQDQRGARRLESFERVTTDEPVESCGLRANFWQLGHRLRVSPPGGFSAPPPRPVFRADHPFLFSIVDRRSGSLLFLGRVNDPTK